MRRVYVSAALLVLLVAGAMGQQGGPAINNFLRVNTEICTGGQPTLAQLAELKAQGVKTIINLRAPGEPGFDAAGEEAEAKKLGLRYFNIPVANQSGPKDEQAAEFLKLTDDPANRPAFIHCGSANRVGGFWMIRRVLRDGYTMEAAKAEADKIGLRSQALVDFATQYIAKNKK
jgi:uncharacterized protein (TIGR01244 family)